MIIRNKVVKMTFGVDEETGNTWVNEKLVRPLPDEEIARIWVDTGVKLLGTDFIEVVRAIEKAHGIGEDK